MLRRRELSGGEGRKGFLRQGRFSFVTGAEMTHLPKAAASGCEQDWRHLSIVVPAYNEPGIADTVSSLAAAVPGAEIIVVDDGSEEPVGPKLAFLGSVRVIRHDWNRGYGASLKTGMSASERPVICWFDGDGQHKPDDLKAAAAALGNGEHFQADACIGVRQRGSVQTLTRLPGKFLLEMVAKSLTGTDIPDLNSGLRAFRREVIERYLHLLPDGFSASSTSTIVMIKRGYRLVYVPINTLPRTGTSTVRFIRDGIGTWRLILNIVILFDAFKIFGLLSLLQIAFSLIYGLVKTFTVGAGFPVFAGVIFISGVITFFMALIADQISAMRQERFELPRR